MSRPSRSTWVGVRARGVAAASSGLAMMVAGVGASAVVMPAAGASAATAPQVITWGSNSPGLGPQTGPGIGEPAVLTGLPASPVQIAASTASYALMPDGTVYAWGENLRGELGDPSFGGESRATPRQVSGLSSIKQIVTGFGTNINDDCGEGFTAALDAQGNVWTWGINDQGELGRSAGQDQSATPTEVTGLGKVVQLSLVDDGVAVLESTGQVVRWGDGSDNHTTVTGLPANIVQISDGVALSTSGSVTTFNDGSGGQARTVSGLPSPVPDGSSVNITLAARPTTTSCP